MRSTNKKSTYVNIWVNIDFNTVKQRIHRVNSHLEKVLHKYKMSPKGDNAGDIKN